MRNLDCLRDDTRNLLRVLIDTAPFLKHYVLVGGSALALHLCHRKSEDLDFFTYDDAFKKEEILVYLNRFDHKEIINQSLVQYGMYLKLAGQLTACFHSPRWLPGLLWL